MSTGRTPDVLPRPVHARRRRVVDVTGWTAGATRSPPGARRHRQARRGPGRGPSCPTTCWSARTAAGAGRERACRGSDRDPLIEAAAALREPGDPFTRAGAALSRRRHRAAGPVPAARIGHPRRAIRRLGGPARWPGSAAWYEMFPRSTGGWDSKGQAGAGHVRHRHQGARRGSPRMGFDVVYLPPIHPIGKVHRKGRNNSRDRRARRCRLAVGDRQGQGRPRRRCTRSSGTIEDFDDFVAAARDQGLEVALDLRPAVRARPPVGQGPPGVVHRACPTAPSPTRRTRRRSTRTSIR